MKNGIIISNPVYVTNAASQEMSKKIVTVGRLCTQKNHKMLITAFKEVVTKYPEYTLEIYGDRDGDGEIEKKLKEQIITLGLKDKVILKGFCKDIHRKIADAELFVLSSDYEGLSNALLEAMSMGIACISTSCAGSDEYITDGINGLLVPVGDHKSMAQAIIRMIEDKQLREKCAKNAAIASNDFTADTVFRKWHNLVEYEA